MEKKTRVTRKAEKQAEIIAEKVAVNVEKKQPTLEERVERLEKIIKDMSYWTGIGV